MTIQRMTDLDLSGKRVLIREDLNVPISFEGGDGAGHITSELRIEAALPTLRAALDAGAAVMVMSHLGRPKEGAWSQADSLALQDDQERYRLGPYLYVTRNPGKPFNFDNYSQLAERHLAGDRGETT